MKLIIKTIAIFFFALSTVTNANENYFPYSKRITNILTELDKIVLKFQGRVYLSKDTRLSSFYFSKFYNQFKEVIKVRKKYNIFNFSSNQSKRIGLDD